MDNEPAYQPQNALQRALQASMATGSGGLLYAAVQNSLARQNVGALGVFTRFGGTIGMFAAVGGTFEFVSIASANLRQKEDPYNRALGGFCGGSVLGLSNRRMSSIVGSGVLVAVVMATVAYTGDSIFTDVADPENDRSLSKAEVRKRFRRPAHELVNVVGEGRGIYGPNYEERRRRRIKENYGIDVPEPFYNKKS